MYVVDIIYHNLIITTLVSRAKPLRNNGLVKLVVSSVQEYAGQIFCGYVTARYNMNAYLTFK